MKNLKKYARRFLETQDISVTKRSTFGRLITVEEKLKRYDDLLPFAARISDLSLKRALSFFQGSMGAIFQDIFAALILNEQRVVFQDLGKTSSA